MLNGMLMKVILIIIKYLGVNQLMIINYFKNNYSNKRLGIFIYPQRQATLFKTKDYVQPENIDDIDKQTLYILFIGDTKNNGHWAAIRYPKTYCNQQSSNNTTPWCSLCATAYTTTCRCLEDPKTKKRKEPPKSKLCENCHQFYKQKSRHECFKMFCKTCKINIDTNIINTHRHTVHRPIASWDYAKIWDEEKQSLYENGIINEKELEEDARIEYLDEEYLDDEMNPTSYWAYDIEVCWKTSQKKYSVRELMGEDDGEGDVEIISRSVNLDEHHVAMIGCENIFTGENEIFYDMSNFLDFVIAKTNDRVELPPKGIIVTQEHHIKGKYLKREVGETVTKPRNAKRRSVWYAHNAMGYDAHFINQGLIEKGMPVQICANGNKLLSMKGSSILWIDSLNHIRSSLDRAIEDFGFLGMKGSPPYKFWRSENMDYIGPVPPREYFSGRSDKTDQMYKMFSVLDQIRGTPTIYDLKKEMRMYLRNDVSKLAELLRTYHNLIKDACGLSPLGITTSAGVAHSIFLKNYLPKAVDQEIRRLGLETNHENRAKYGWAVQEQEERAIWAKAFHGGNTGVRRDISVESSTHKGIGIDIVSSYPAQQVFKPFPAGFATIEVYEKSSFPCSKHYLQDARCSCSYKYRKQFVNKRLNIEEKYGQSIDLNKLKFYEGCIECDLSAMPDDFHPMIFQFDKDTKKNINDCTEKNRVWITFPEAIEFIRRGGKIEKVYCISRYHKAESYWRQMIKDFLVLKIRSEGGKNLQDANRITALWQQHLLDPEFKIWEDDAIEFPKNPALRQTAKIILNSIWGKSAETIYQDTRITIRGSDHDKLEKHIQKLQDGEYSKFSQYHMNDMIMLTVQLKFENNEHQKPNLDRQYLPAACYVTTYGRLQLQKMLDYYGDDVVNYDTDSVWAFSDKPNPPISKLLGGWSLEDCCSKENKLIKMLCGGPKLYAYKFDEHLEWNKLLKPNIRERTIIKSKGLRLDGKAKEDFTFKKFEDLCLGKRSVINVRQELNFESRPREGVMITRPIIKQVKAPRWGAQPKGVWFSNEDGSSTLYPFGHRKVIEQEELEIKEAAEFEYEIFVEI